MGQQQRVSARLRGGSSARAREAPAPRLSHDVHSSPSPVDLDNARATHSRRLRGRGRGRARPGEFLRVGRQRQHGRARHLLQCMPHRRPECRVRPDCRACRRACPRCCCRSSCGCGCWAAQTRRGSPRRAPSSTNARRASRPGQQLLRCVATLASAPRMPLAAAPTCAPVSRLQLHVHGPDGRDDVQLDVHL